MATALFCRLTLNFSLSHRKPSMVTDLSAEEVALKYKQHWQVERIFCDDKTLLETRPVFHRWDDTIRGHVFCSFLAIVLRKELYSRLEDNRRVLRVGTDQAGPQGPADGHHRRARQAFCHPKPVPGSLRQVLQSRWGCLAAHDTGAISESRSAL
jgi:hypothetical protein